MQYLIRAAAAALLAASLSGCSIISIAATAGSVAVSAGSLAVDAAIGTARIAGKAVGAAADAVLPSGEAAK
jgi:hypothetical protein